MVVASVVQSVVAAVEQGVVVPPDAAPEAVASMMATEQLACLVVLVVGVGVEEVVVVNVDVVVEDLTCAKHQPQAHAQAAYGASGVIAECWATTTQRAQLPKVRAME